MPKPQVGKAEKLGPEALKRASATLPNWNVSQVGHFHLHLTADTPSGLEEKPTIRLPTPGLGQGGEARGMKWLSHSVPWPGQHWEAGQIQAIGNRQSIQKEEEVSLRWSPPFHVTDGPRWTL